MPALNPTSTEPATEPQPAPADLAEQRLRSNPYLALKSLSCDCQDGVLVLRGCLPSYYLKQVAQEVVASEPRARLEVDVHPQYRNMHRYLESAPYAAAAAEEAIRAEGLEPVRNPIRGGTDGSRLSEMGLPTPNIFTGAHEFHSVREWASLQDMAASAATIVRLAEVWTRPTYAGLDGNGHQP